MCSITRFWSKVRKKYRRENVPPAEPGPSKQRKRSKSLEEKRVTDSYILNFSTLLPKEDTSSTLSEGTVKTLNEPPPKRKKTCTQTLCGEKTNKAISKESLTPTFTAGELCTPVGLTNFGNTCYINSSLQLLFTADAFCRKLSNIMDSCVNGEEDAFLSSFVKLWKMRYKEEDQFGIRKDILLLALINEVTTVNPTFTIFEPNNGVTFICQCLEQIIEAARMLGWKDDSDPRCPTGSNFDVKMKKVIKCSRCAFQQNILEECNIITVPLSFKSVDRFLYNIFNKQQELQQKCQTCQKQHVSSIWTFHTLPKFLILHLERDQVDKKAMLKYPMVIQPQLTINSTTQSPNFFFLRPSRIFRSRKENNELKVTEAWRDGLDGSTSTYRLISVVSVVADTQDEGHGVADCYTHNPPQWWTCNDEFITQTTEKDVLKKRLSNAYLLLYERVSTG